MSEKKTCVACGKQIPSVALVCVFCSAAQPDSGDAAATAGATGTGSGTSAAEAATLVSNHATDPTLLGLKTSDLQAALAEAPGAGSGGAPPANGTPAATRPTAAIPVVTAPSDDDGVPAHEPESAVSAASDDDRDFVPVEVAPPEQMPEPIEPWGPLGRLVMGVGGLVLVALFFCPWHGVSSWQLLETLSGADFVRQLFYLTGGIVLVASAVLPLPFVFRAGVGTFVASLPVLLGASGVLDGWRGVVAALAILGLPATHLLRSRAQTSAVARPLALAAVAAVLLLYLLPTSSVVPIAFVFKMIASGSLGYAVLGLFVLVPLVFAGLSLLGVLGRDLTDIGALLSVLILLWAPVTVALRGLMIDDGTQLYVAVALLWASATAALSLAQLLAVTAGRAQHGS
jgi:hypothetical protein